MLKIYQRFWQVNWAEQWQYRANMFMFLLFWLVSPIVYLAVWTTISSSQGSVGGLTPNDFVTYYMILLLIDQLTSDITIHIFAYKIQDGSLAGELIRPAHPMLTNALVTNISFKVLMLMILIPVWLVLWILFQPNFSTVTVQGILLAVPAVLLGFAISFLFGASLTCIAFWTTRVWSLAEFYWAMIALFSGQFVPLQLMPEVIQRIALLLPFQLFKYFPVQIVLGRLPPSEIISGYLTGLVWLVVALCCFILIWKNGVKKFSAVGA